MGGIFKRKSSDQAERRQRFEQTALVHMDALYGMALRLTRNARDADDLLQDALVRAYRFFDSYQEGSNIRAWLFKIVTNTFYNSIRKSRNIKKLEAEAETGWHHERFMSNATGTGRSAEDALLDAISSEQLKLAIEELPEDFRIVVMLCDVQGFSYKEIAEIVDCPVGTVMSRLHRGRGQLKRKLYDYALERGLITVEPKTGSQSGTPADLNAYRNRKAGN